MREADKVLTEAVARIAEPFWSEVHQGHVAHLNRLLESYCEEAALGDGTFTPPHEHYRKTQRFDLADEVRHFVGYKDTQKRWHSPHEPVVVRDNAEAVVDRLSRRHADEVVATFKRKLLGKLAGVLGASDVKGEVSGYLGRNRVQVCVADVGLEFQVRSQVVSVWPWHAAPHHRYPTTFHNVRVRGEWQAKKMSEREVKALAAKLRGERYESPEKAQRKAARARKEDRHQAKVKKELEKARGALERALARCERAATEFDLFSAKRDHERAHGCLSRALKRYELPLEGEELLARKPNLNVDDPDTAEKRLKALKVVLREAKKDLPRLRAGAYGGADLEKLARDAEKRIAGYEALAARLKELVQARKG